jgi:4-amino-4-deoxychorismate lyase
LGDFVQQPSVSDRSFQYGDGIFSTIRVKNGQLQFWHLHWQRLHTSMQRLGFAALPEAEVKAAAQAQISQPDQVVKILISRGHGGRGYSALGFDKADLYCSVSALPDYEKAQQQGISVGVAKLQLGVQPLLAGIKHTSRLETVLHKAEVEQSHFDELLVCDSQGYVTEFSSANVFFYLDDHWCTPELHQAGVAGVMRAFLLNNMDVIVGRYQQQDIKKATAMFATNALMGVVPVCRYLQQPLSLELVRPVQQLLLTSSE